MASSYWQTVSRYRIARRRALAATSTGAAAAFLLAACGSDEASQPTSSEATGSAPGRDDRTSTSLVAPIVDDTPSLKRGGIINSLSTLEHPTLDPMVGGGHVGLLRQVQSTLFRVVDGYMEKTHGEYEGDLVESWEFSPDQLQLTLKLKRNAHFAPISPVNGRRVDAHDIAFSWQVFAEQGRGRLELANSADPNAPVLAVTATDDNTVVLDLKEPNATLIPLLALDLAGAYWIMPKEADGGFDIRRTMIGSSAFYLSNYEPSVRYELSRNPNFHDERDLPYVDGISMPIVLETATRVSQFRAGQIWTQVVPPADVLAVKEAVPELNLFDMGLSSSFFRMFFGHLPDSPFRDQRLRQAWMHMMDRDAFLSARFEIPIYENKGIAVQTSWDYAKWGETWSGWWLDPKGPQFGPNAKYLEHDLEAAKQLVTAAGYPNGIDVTYTHTEGYRGVWQDEFAMSFGFASADSKIFRVNQYTASYATSEYQNEYRDARGEFVGVSARHDSAPENPVLNLIGHYNSRGGQYQGNDSILEDLTTKMAREFDTEAQRALAFDVQRHDAESAFFPLLGSASSFQAWWPVLRNVQVWQGGSVRENATLFIDETKPPLNRA